MDAYGPMDARGRGTGERRIYRAGRQPPPPIPGAGERGPGGHVAALLEHSAAEAHSGPQGGPALRGTRRGDLGKIDDYNEFLDALAEVFDKVYAALKPGKYCCAVVMDIRKRDRFYPLHSDLARRMEEVGFIFDDIIIWDRGHEYNNLRAPGISRRLPCQQGPRVHSHIPEAQAHIPEAQGRGTEPGGPGVRPRSASKGTLCYHAATLEHGEDVANSRDVLRRITVDHQGCQLLCPSPRSPRYSTRRWPSRRPGAGENGPHGCKTGEHQTLELVPKASKGVRAEPRSRYPGSRGLPSRQGVVRRRAGAPGCVLPPPGPDSLCGRGPSHSPSYSPPPPIAHGPFHGRCEGWN